MILDKIRQRQKSLGVSFADMAELLDIEAYEVQNYFELSEISNANIHKITNLLGLDSLGNELVSIEELLDKRAEQKALYIVSLVQDTSSLENQGLETGEIWQLLQDTKEQFLSGKYRDSLWKK